MCVHRKVTSLRDYLDGLAERLSRLWKHFWLIKKNLGQRQDIRGERGVLTQCDEGYSSLQLHSRLNFGERVLSIFLGENNSCHLWFLQQQKVGERKKFAPRGWAIDKRKRKGGGGREKELLPFPSLLYPLSTLTFNQTCNVNLPQNNLVPRVLSLPPSRI